MLKLLFLAALSVLVVGAQPMPPAKGVGGHGTVAHGVGSQTEKGDVNADAFPVSFDGFPRSEVKRCSGVSWFCLTHDD
jgi:hypothetical protein